MAILSTTAQRPPGIVPQRRPFSRGEYYQMDEIGLFEGQRVELIGGEIISMPPMGAGHSTGIGLVEEALREVFTKGYLIRVQLPFVVDDQTELQPDVAVVSGQWRDFKDEHPNSAVLVVEVAETSLSFDRGVKSGAYAKAAVPEYWVVNLQNGCLEVYREPLTMKDKPFEAGYRASRVYLADEIVCPSASPDGRIRVADLLP